MGAVPAQSREDANKDEEGYQRADAEKHERREEPRGFESMEVVVRRICAHHAREIGTHHASRCDELLRQIFCNNFARKQVFVVLEMRLARRREKPPVLKEDGCSSSRSFNKDKAGRVAGLVRSNCGVTELDATEQTMLAAKIEEIRIFWTVPCPSACHCQLVVATRGAQPSRPGASRLHFLVRCLVPAGAICSGA